MYYTNIKVKILIRYLEEILPGEGHEALVQGAQRGCGCLWIPAIVQSQAGQGLDHPGILEVVPAHGRGGTG